MGEHGDHRVPQDCNYMGLKCTALQLGFDRILQPQQGERSGKGTIRQNRQGKFRSDLSTQGSAVGFGRLAPPDSCVSPVVLPTRGKSQISLEMMWLWLRISASVWRMHFFPPHSCLSCGEEPTMGSLAGHSLPAPPLLPCSPLTNNNLGCPSPAACLPSH